MSRIVDGLTDLTMVTQNISKGPILIIVCTRHEEGGIENVILVFKSDQKTGDYHNEINGDTYKNGLKSNCLSIFLVIKF